MHALNALLESNITRTILAISAICVSFLIYRLNKKRKRLSCRIVTKTTLFDFDREIKTDYRCFWTVSLRIRSAWY